MNYFFTADEHYGHINIIKYCNRPFGSVHEMNQQLIRNHNSLVKPGDITIHAGDFTLEKDLERVHRNYIQPLNGNHVFLQGSHDRWLKDGKFLWEKTIDDQRIVVCHYPMRSWPRSHYGSWLLYGHTHGRLKPWKNQLDVGVDCWNFSPLSWDQVKILVSSRFEPEEPH